MKKGTGSEEELERSKEKRENDHQQSHPKFFATR